jgi:hypothetical protein
VLTERGLQLEIEELIVAVLMHLFFGSCRRTRLGGTLRRAHLLVQHRLTGDPDEREPLRAIDHCAI